MNCKQTFSFALVLLLFGCAKDDHLQQAAAEALPPGIQARIDAAMDELNNEDPVFVDGEISTRATVYLEANSHNALYNAIQAVGNGGKIILKAGNHTESGTVIVDKSVKITGQNGAVLMVNVGPAVTSVPTGPYQLSPALHVYKKANVKISNLEIRPMNGNGSTAILIDHAPSTQVYGNHIHSFQYGVIVSNGSQSRIYDNHLVGYSTGLENEGIVNINGEYVKIYNNEIEQYLIGVFGSDRKGTLSENVFHHNAIGVLLCTVPGGFLSWNGVELAAKNPANDWLLAKNNAHDNGWGYLVIDKAFNNILHLNDAASNAFYDIELAGDSERFGFFTPTSKGNFVCSAGDYKDVIVKDCGQDNFVVGGTSVDTSTDACY